MQKLALNYIMRILVCCGWHVHNYGMISTLRSKLPQAIATPRTLLSRYYSRYQTTSKPIQKQTQSTFSTVPQARHIHTTPASSFRATRPSLFSEWIRWFKGKPTAQSMFTLFDQFLKDSSGFDALMAHIKNGDYDEIINATREIFLNNKSTLMNILDQSIIHLVQLDTFGSAMNINKYDYPNLTSSNFFNIHNTPKLITLIDILLQKDTPINIKPSHMFFQMAQMYGLIKNGILAPQDPILKQEFLNYVASIKRIAQQIYERYSISSEPFDTIFEQKANQYEYISQEKKGWIEEQATLLITLINKGEYTIVLDKIKSGTFDDVINESYTLDYFFGLTQNIFVSPESLTLFERILQIWLKTKRLNVPEDIQTKTWSDIFNPQKDPQLFSILQELSNPRYILSKYPNKRTKELLTYTFSTEIFIIPPTDPVIASQYKQFIKNIEHIAQKIFDRQLTLHIDSTAIEAHKQKFDNLLLTIKEQILNKKKLDEEISKQTPD
ncbi:MAG TPA: hypothetical protein VGW78_03295 [Candidatus Babeliales bacterium]|jgi:hypothetical protein|nr:hypothetical protein [Candidatus Babeliales bacterium]